MYGKACGQGLYIPQYPSKKIKQGNNKLTQLPPSKTNTWLGDEGKLGSLLSYAYSPIGCRDLVISFVKKDI
jgi:hypothetical protein